VIIIEMPHAASRISRGRTQAQIIIIGHQTIGEDLNSPKGMGLVQHLEKGLVISGSPEGRLASQPTVHHMIEYIRILKTQKAESYERPSAQTKLSTLKLISFLTSINSSDFVWLPAQLCILRE
jgi:hypothetical protein